MENPYELATIHLCLKMYMWKRTKETYAIGLASSVNSKIITHIKNCGSKSLPRKDITLFIGGYTEMQV